MSAIVRNGQQGLTMVQAQAQALDVALRAAGALKNARGLLPEGLKNEGEIVAVLLAGQELGLPPMASLRGLQVVRGKVIISYDTMVALLRRAGYRIEWLTSSATEARLRLTAQDGSTHTERWDEARAKKAGLWGSSTWAKYPDTMLKARCVSSAARAFAGEVLAGVYLEESGEGDEIAQRAPEPPVERHEPADVVDADPEQPATPAQLRECRTAEELQAWIAAHAPHAAEQHGGDVVGAKVLEHADKIGVDPADVDRWLGAAIQK